MRKLNKDEFDVKKEQYIDKLVQELPKVNPIDAKIGINLTDEQIVAKALNILLVKMLNNKTDNMTFCVKNDNKNFIFRLILDDVIKESD